MINKEKITYNWALEELFKFTDINDPAIEENLEIVKQKHQAFVSKWEPRTDYLENASVLREALDEYEALNADQGSYGNSWYYVWAKSQLDMENKEVTGKLAHLEEAGTKIANDMQFFMHRISKLDSAKQNEFLNSSELSIYKHFLETNFNTAKYLLSEPEEKVLNLLSPTAFSNWTKMTKEFLFREVVTTLDEDGEMKEKSLSEVINLLSSTNKKVRDMAAEHLNAIMAKYKDVAEKEINSILKTKKVEDELRGLSRPDLARALADDLDIEVIDSLLEAVHERNDLSSRFYKLKAALLGLEKLEYHERNVPVSEVEKEYSYPASVELVENTMANLDPEFASIFKSFVENGQIDVNPSKGKAGGAYCIHVSKTQPILVLLNHSSKLNEVLTIAHEMGHAINNVFMQKAQHALDADTSLSTAEVASTFMEDFVLQELLNTATDEEKLSILVAKLGDDVSSIHRQVACFRFEQELHKTFREKNYLSSQQIGEIFQKHMSSYMGDFVIQSPGAENWWIYWSHIRRFFYVYSYASGLLISKSLQNAYKKDKAFIEKVKTFLSAGTSKSPKDIFADLEIDITKKEFWLDGLKEIEVLLDETEDLAKKLGKI